MKTIKGTEYSAELEDMHSIVKINKFTLSMLDKMIDAGGGLENQPDEVKANYATLTQMVEEYEAEIRTTQLLHEAEIQAGNYNEYPADEDEYPPFMYLSPN